MRWMTMGKKGQGLSLNVIIIAALALIVLVVLIMIFTGRIGIFQAGVGGEAEAELNVMKVSYGDCHPNDVSQDTFVAGYSGAVSNDDPLTANNAKEDFKQLIINCKGGDTKDSCDDKSQCSWQ
jgi:hypothetical protein